MIISLLASSRANSDTMAPSFITRIRSLIPRISGRPIRSKGRATIQGGDFIRLELPGGGGFGDPATRDPEQVALDVADGLIDAETARTAYRVALAAGGGVDRAATAKLRDA